MLKEAGDRFGFGVSHMGTLTFDHERISSTRIRDALSTGDFAWRRNCSVDRIP